MADRFENACPMGVFEVWRTGNVLTKWSLEYKDTFDFCASGIESRSLHSSQLDWWARVYLWWASNTQGWTRGGGTSRCILGTYGARGDALLPLAHAETLLQCSALLQHQVPAAVGVSRANAGPVTPHPKTGQSISIYVLLALFHPLTHTIKHSIGTHCSKLVHTNCTTHTVCHTHKQKHSVTIQRRRCIIPKASQLGNSIMVSISSSKPHLLLNHSEWIIRQSMPLSQVALTKTRVPVQS